MERKYTYEELEQQLRDLRAYYENQIKTEKHRYKFLFNNTGTATFIFRDDKIITLCNKEFELLSGYSKEEIEGKLKWSDFVAKEDLKRMEEYHRQRTEQTGNPPTRYEFVFITRNGERKNIYFKLGMLSETKERVASLTNITPLKHAQSELEEKHRMLETLLANLPGMVYRCRNLENWNMLYVSEGCMRVTGYPPDAFINNRDLAYGDIVHPEDKGNVWTKIQQSIKDNSHFEIEYRILTADNHIRWVWERGKTINHGKNGVELLEGFIMDITDRKEAEIKQDNWNKELEDKVVRRTKELEKANKELESFSYSVSHDLKAPLRAIEGFSKVLEEDYFEKLDDEAKRYLNIIRSNASKMNQLISDLLAFSRLGRKALRTHNVDTKKLVEEVCRELPKEILKKIEFKFMNLPPVRADRSMLKIVFSNLVSNAVKFTAQKAKPEIEVGSFQDMNNKTVFYVKDNGVGFNMEFADKIFGTFQRLHSDEEYQGSGIGLSLVKRVIEKHGGTIWAEAKQNEGATFYFYLPGFENEQKNE
ncbi:MAG: PAS domain-containing protein [Bacteroidales bacterium]